MKALGLLALTLALADPGFHPPATEAEKTLNALLRKSERDGDLLSFLLQLPKRTTSNDAAFSRLFTRPLLDAIRLEQQKALNKNCHGRYTPDEICGLEDANVVTCAQDTNDVYLYRTEGSSPGKVTISYTWPDQPTAGTYVLLKDGNRWKLDGIHCREMPALHMR